MNTETLLLFLGEFFAKATAVLLLAAFVVQIRQRSSAAERHFVWLAAIIVVLLLPLTKLVSPWWGFSVENPVETTRSSVVASQTSVEGISMVSTTPPEITAARSPSAWRLPNWQPVVVGTWAVGCLAFLCYRLLGLWRLRRLEKRSESLSDARLETMAKAVLREMQIARPVRLVLSAECRVPMTWGTRQPILVLPSEALEWSESRVTAALRHEAGHISRGDYAARWIAHVASSVYWLHPLIWLATRSLRVAQEQATDDLVLRAGTPPDEYAAQLFDSARAVAMHGVFARHAVAMATPSTLEHRVLAIVDDLRDRRPLSRLAAAASVATMILALALCTAAQMQAAPPASSSSPAATSSTPEKTTPPTVPAMPARSARERADEQIIPLLKFNDTPLQEVIEFIQQQSSALATAENARVKIVSSFDLDNQTRLSLEMKNVSVWHALRLVSSLGNLEINEDREALVLTRQTITTGASSQATPDTEPPRTIIPEEVAVSPAKERAQRIVIPKLSFRDAPVSRILDFLRDQGNSTGGPVKITSPAPRAREPEISLDLTNIPLWEALRYTAELGNLHIRVQPEALVLVAMTEAEIQAAQKEAEARAAAAPVGSENPLPIGINSDHSEMSTDGRKMTAEGHVKVTCGTATLTAEQVIYHTNQRFVEASGNVEVRQAGNDEVVTSERMMVGFRGDGRLTFIGKRKVNGKEVPAGLSGVLEESPKATSPSPIQPPSTESTIRGRAGVEIRTSNPALDRSPAARRTGEK